MTAEPPSSNLPQGSEASRSDLVPRYRYFRISTPTSRARAFCNETTFLSPLWKLLEALRSRSNLHLARLRVKAVVPVKHRDAVLVQIEARHSATEYHRAREYSKLSTMSLAGGGLSPAPKPDARQCLTPRDKFLVAYQPSQNSRNRCHPGLVG